MSISIYSSSSSHISINLLEIAFWIIRKYTKDEDYLIDIDLHLRSFFEDYTWQDLFIVDDRYIVEESNLNYIDDGENGTNLVKKYSLVNPFTEKSAIKLLEKLILEWLSQIYIRAVTIDIEWANICFTFWLWGVSLEEYKNLIHELINNEIKKFKLPYGVSAIENDLWSKLYSLSKRFKVNTIEIEAKELWLDTYSKNVSSKNNDDIGIFNIRLYDSLVDLFLSKLIINGKIKSYQSIWFTKIKIELDLDSLDFLTQKKSDIYLDEANRVLTIKWNDYRLEISENYYKILKFLLEDNQATLFTPKELLKQLDIYSGWPYEYIKQAKHEIRKKYWKDVSDLIHIKNKHITLGVI